MENAAEALKTAFAVLVFVIAMSLGFMLITQARSTADVVFATKDKQEYVEGITSIRQTSNKYRIVGLDTVIPAIYRYAQENYGVIIVDKNSRNGNYEIVGIYDLEVEDNVSNWSSQWDTGENYENQFEQMCLGQGTYNNDGTSENIPGIDDYVNDTVEEKISMGIEDFKKLFNNIYKISNQDSTYCPWTSSTYNIMQRIKADMNGDTTYFGANNTLQYSGKHWKDEGFMDTYGGFMDTYGGDTTFKEYYYTVKEQNNITLEEETTKLQIIYVVQQS